MSRLVVVRHAQASFFAKDYDQLSDLGGDQASRLGEYWAQQGISFDRVYVGPRRRHRQTWEAMRKGAGDYCLCEHDATELPDFDEYQIDVFLQRAAQVVSTDGSPLDSLWAAYRNAKTPTDKLAAFQHLFQAIAMQWRKGKLISSEVESWLAFKERVNRGVSHICSAASRGATLLGITSAGTSGMIFQRATHCSDEKALEVGWVVRNTSISEYLFSGDRFGLNCFNNWPHLSEPELITFR